jgi:hypothetical protein
VALISGIVLFVLLEGKRKLFGVVLALAFPMMLFLSISIGDSLSWESKTESDGKLIAEALEQYRAENGVFPQSLDELIPTYLSELNEPQSVWGWLYTATADIFTLGYVYDVDNLGYGVCVYSSSILEWDCLPYSSGPFDLPPTPFP